MKVIGREIIEQFGVSRADSRGALRAWLNEAKAAEWRTPHDIKERYRSASIIGGKNVVFDIKGGSYRVWALVDYQRQIVIVKKIGTHREYDTWRIP